MGKVIAGESAPSPAPQHVRHRFARWSGILSEFLAAQIASQAIAALVGVLLVRSLPVREFALYSLALAAMTFVSVISDSGVSGAMHYFYRKALTRHAAYGPYLAASLGMRRRLMLVAWVCVVAYVYRTGTQANFYVSELAAVVAVMLPATYFQVHSSIGLTLLRLRHQYRRSYGAELAGSAIRLAVITLLILANQIVAWTAVMGAAFGSSVTRYISRIRDSNARSDAHSASAQTVAKTAILRFVVPTTPGTLYFALQGPLLVWLCSQFGGITVMAEVGAVGRLAVILSLIAGFVSSIFVPRLASVTDDRIYLRRYLIGWGALLASGGAILAACVAVPDWFIWLLGDSYRHLEDQVLVVTSSAVAMTWSGYATAVKHARGWVRYQPFVIVILVALQAALIVHLDLSTAHGVLLFQLGSSLALLAVEATNNLIGFFRPSLISVDKAPA